MHPFASGSAIALVVGGANESLSAEPGTRRLFLLSLIIQTQGPWVTLHSAIDEVLCVRSDEETSSMVGVICVQALLYDARLVPVLGFGETDVFAVCSPFLYTTRSHHCAPQVAKWPALRRLQEKLQRTMGFAMPIFHGRSQPVAHAFSP
eukprot:759278-Hanusia_phi.AAC.3